MELEMEPNHDDGGNAFPLQCFLGQHRHGMSLRDYFAAKAMAALLDERRNWPLDQIADTAYAMADAMLRDRIAQSVDAVAGTVDSA
jgi:hypothetical protein